MVQLLNIIRSSVNVFGKFRIYSCPVDNSVFPPLDKAREGDGLEARFQAFKIPESNYLIFEATVRTCREGCTPVSGMTNVIEHGSLCS